MPDEPPPPWFWPGPDLYVLKEEDHVFVSAPPQSDLNYTIHEPLRIIKGFGLVPYVYSGLRKPPLGITDTTVSEAVDDLYNSQAVFVILPLSCDGTVIENNWAMTEISRAMKNGVLGFVYFLETEYSAALYEVSDPIFLPKNIRIRTVSCQDGFVTAFHKDLLSCTGVDHDEKDGSR